MRILGIDPGLATLGYGVIDTAGSRVALVEAGAIITTPDMKEPDRLVSIRRQVKELLEKFRPDQIAFEELFFYKNITTGMSVSAARGVTVCACAEYTDQLYEYTPMQIKSTIAGYGHAQKYQVQEMVKMILNMRDIIRPDDAADAVAVALTHQSVGALRSEFRMK
ncbi:MAG: crossover junction endodeoxyribonuclease RuvC [Clostridia bacterium]|nr:crossover junction endodeoxyribonuclease RuvC [Clostridia bacterium]